MNSTRFASIAATVLVACGAFAQSPTNRPFTPSTFKGHGFWFGPGPADHTLASYDWDNDNRAWFEYDGSGQTVGGPINFSLFKGAGGTNMSFAQGFVGFPNNWAFRDVVQARTTINVRPYVYVDGYFGLIADVQGWGRADHLPIGSSDFYILHNTPVYVRFDNFTNADWQGNTLGKAPVNPFGTIPMEYSAEAFRTTSGGAPLTNQFTSLGSVQFSPLAGGVQPQLLYIDPVDSNFFAKITINRFATINYNVPAGVYRSTGVVSISSF